MGENFPKVVLVVSSVCAIIILLLYFGLKLSQFVFLPQNERGAPHRLVILARVRPRNPSPDSGVGRSVSMYRSPPSPPPPTPTSSITLPPGLYSDVLSDEHRSEATEPPDVSSPRSAMSPEAFRAGLSPGVPFHHSNTDSLELSTLDSHPNVPPSELVSPELAATGDLWNADSDQPPSFDSHSTNLLPEKSIRDLFESANISSIGRNRRETAASHSAVPIEELRSSEEPKTPYSPEAVDFSGVHSNHSRSFDAQSASSSPVESAQYLFETDSNQPPSFDARSAGSSPVESVQYLFETDSNMQPSSSNAYSASSSPVKSVQYLFENADF